MFEILSNAELLAIYNTHAPKSAVRFESRRIGESRTFKVLQAKGMTIEEAIALAKIDPHVAAFAPLPALPLASAPIGERPKTDAEFASEYAAGKLARIGQKDIEPAVRPTHGVVETMIERAKLTGKKLALFRMMLRADGVSEAEGCSELAWAGCSATMFRVYQAAETVGFVMRKWKGADHKMRYGATISDPA